MQNYTIKHKDNNLVLFSCSKKEVDFAVILKGIEEYLPLPLKRIIHNKEEFVLSENPNYYQLNDEGSWLVDAWITDRQIL